MKRISIRCISIIIPILLILHLCQAEECVRKNKNKHRKYGKLCNTHFDCSNARELVNAEQTMPCAYRDEILLKYFEICCNLTNIILTTPNPSPPSQAICGPFGNTSTTPRPVPSSKNSTAIQIALQKCQEYGEHRYVNKWTDPQLPGQKGYYYKHLSDCLDTAALPQKTPGKTRDYHHMALIGYGREFNNVSWDCDGALISEKFVMTSGRCSQTSASGPPQWVLLREVVLYPQDGYTPPKSKVYSIVKIHVHSDYLQSSSFQHDISLIELNATVTFNPYLRPACLHASTSDIPINSFATITGWERTGRAERTSDNLLEAAIKIIDHQECQISFNENSTEMARLYDSNAMICGRDAHAGPHWNCRSFEESHIKADSGGVLQILSPGELCKWNIIGIASFGTGICQHNGYPGVYTKVSHYVDWIQSIVWP